MPEENVLFARETDAPAVSEDTSGEVQASKYLICISDGLLYGGIQVVHGCRQLVS